MQYDTDTIRSLTERVLNNLEHPQIPLEDLLPALAADCRRILARLDDDDIDLNAERYYGYKEFASEKT